MQKTALITGVAGQDGAYLADFLLRKKYRVVGILPSKGKKKMGKLDYFGIANKIVVIEGSICNARLMGEILKEYKPDELYNLAGQSSVAKSWEDPIITFKINASAVIQTLQMIKTISPRTRFLQCSTAEIYGEAGKIITDDCVEHNPLNPYGISKLAAHLAVKNFRAQYGLFACNAILFNHESPLRADYTATKKIANAAARIALGLEENIKLGNINVSRDWGYAGDFVKAMWLILRGKEPKDYVVSTGVSFPLKRFVEEAFKCVNKKNWSDYVIFDKSLKRKSDIKSMRGSPRNIIKELGWKPETDFKDLVKIMVDYELDKIKKSV